MKNILLFLFVSSTFLITSCGSDSVEESIIGKWEISSFSATGCDDASDNVSFNFNDGNCFDQSGQEFCLEIEFEFKSDGSMIQKTTTMFLGTQDSETVNYNYSVDGNNITVCETATDCSTQSFTINGNTLSFGFQDSDNCNVTISAKRK